MRLTAIPNCETAAFLLPLELNFKLFSVAESNPNEEECSCDEELSVPPTPRSERKLQREFLKKHTSRYGHVSPLFFLRVFLHEKQAGRLDAIRVRKMQHAHM